MWPNSWQQLGEASVAGQRHAVERSVETGGAHVEAVGPDGARAAAFGLVVTGEKEDHVLDVAVFLVVPEVNVLVGQAADLHDQFGDALRTAVAGVVARRFGDGVGAVDFELGVELAVGVLVVVVPGAARRAVDAVSVLVEQVRDRSERVGDGELRVGVLHENDGPFLLARGLRVGDACRGRDAVDRSLGHQRLPGVEAAEGRLHGVDGGRPDAFAQLRDDGAFPGVEPGDGPRLDGRGRERAVGGQRGVIVVAVRTAGQGVPLVGEGVMREFVSDDADGDFRTVALRDFDRFRIGGYGCDLGDAACEQSEERRAK